MRKLDKRLNWSLPCFRACLVSASSTIDFSDWTSDRRLTDSNGPLSFELTPLETTRQCQARREQGPESLRSWISTTVSVSTHSKGSAHLSCRPRWAHSHALYRRSGHDRPWPPCCLQGCETGRAHDDPRRGLDGRPLPASSRHGYGETAGTWSDGAENGRRGGGPLHAPVHGLRHGHRHGLYPSQIATRPTVEYGPTAHVINSGPGTTISKNDDNRPRSSASHPGRGACYASHGKHHPHRVCSHTRQTRTWACQRRTAPSGHDEPLTGDWRRSEGPGCRSARDAHTFDGDTLESVGSWTISERAGAVVARR